MNGARKQEFPDVPGFVIVKELGSSRCSTVYLAKQTSLGRFVAIKILKQVSTTNCTRFDREADIMASFSHQHLVSVFERGTANGCEYIAMEYIAAGSLAAQLKAGLPLDLWTVTKILHALCSALTAVHTRGLIHRDVKPGNVLFGLDGQIKLCDFGISVTLEEQGQLTDDNTSPGTLDYMAPEQRYRLDVNTQADQYSLAVVAYQMLTGSLPGHMLVNASQKNPLLNTVIDDIFSRALQEDPEARFPTVSLFVEALTSALEELSIVAVRTTRFRIQRRVVVSVLTVAALAVVCCVYMAQSDTKGQEGRNSVVSAKIDDGFEFTGDNIEPQVTPELEEQTGALIWRDSEKGGVEILLVRARSGGHWTIPKATQTPRASTISVAEEEAFEEAGVKGKATRHVVDTYNYSRAGKTYRVSVLAVRCDEELAVWPESFRKRTWITPKMGEQMIASDKLRIIVHEFQPDTEATSANRSSSESKGI
jgi:serine/threonine protein kinase/8-oxo-dGTP pyrophosphatase MutT (NUDIX family)